MNKGEATPPRNPSPFPYSPSHQRRKQPQRPARRPLKERISPAFLQRDRFTFCDGRLEIPLDLQDHGILVNIRGALKVQVQAAEVQIDGSHHRLAVVADKFLCVHKSRRVLIDLHAGLD